MAVMQQHLKRLLAYSTISHMGLFLIGVALFDPAGLAGTALYTVSHGLVKGALFLGAGVLVYRFAAIDEEALRGRGRHMIGVAAVFLLGGLTLAELPPFGTFAGTSLIAHAAGDAGYHWMPWLFGACSALTGGAVLRAAGRVFLGWGPDEPDRFAADRTGEEEPEVEQRHDRTPAVMAVPMVALLVAGLAVAAVPGLRGQVVQAAAGFQARDRYEQAVLFDRSLSEPLAQAEPPGLGSYLFGSASALAAVAVALLSLFRRRLIPPSVRQTVRTVFGPSLRELRRLHSGHVGDYAAWFVVGLAVYGALFLLVLR
jgi:multicomponent Na+:H+ antiporter subunit D